MNWFSRRAFMRLGFAGGVAVAPYGYGATHGRTGLRVEHSDCPLTPQAAGLDGFKVAVMADFHFDETLDSELIEAAVEKSNALQPDVVLLPGDFVSRDTDAAQPLADILGQLRATHGVYATLGNHDHWTLTRVIAEALENAGIDLLRNESRLLLHGDQRFAVVGLDSVWGGYPKPVEATRDLPEDVPRILSVHEPDYFDELAAAMRPRAVLQVSGHTHGGQVCAPFIGPLLLPRWGKKYPAGPYGEAGARLYVTRGVGTIGPSARFLCRPEVSLITLRA